MTTIPHTTPPSKAYYAHLDDEHGILTRDAQGQIWFRNTATQELTAITPEHVNFLSVHGEVAVSAVQAMADVRLGGAVGVCLTRAQEVS